MFTEFRDAGSLTHFVQLRVSVLGVWGLRFRGTGVRRFRGVGFAGFGL